MKRSPPLPSNHHSFRPYHQNDTSTLKRSKSMKDLTKRPRPEELNGRKSLAPNSLSKSHLPDSRTNSRHGNNGTQLTAKAASNTAPTLDEAVLRQMRTPDKCEYVYKAMPSLSVGQFLERTGLNDQVLPEKRPMLKRASSIPLDQFLLHQPIEHVYNSFCRPTQS